MNTVETTTPKPADTTSTGEGATRGDRASQGDKPRFIAHPKREEAQRMLREGVDPREVTSKLNLHWRLVRQWAIDVGQAPEDQRGPARARRERAESLLRAGRRPKEVAAESGASLSAVRGWARQLGLPPLQGRRPAHPGRIQAEGMLREGMSVRDVAAAVGALVDTVYHWKRQMEWVSPTDTPPIDPRERHPQRDAAEEMLRAGDSTRKVAAALGIGRSTAWDWRRQLGLGKH